MKKKSKLMLGASLLVVPTVIYATVTTVDDLDVRHSGDTANTVSNSSTAIGYNNTASSRSLAVGSHHNVQSWSFAVGSSNTVKKHSGAVGYLHYVNHTVTGDYPRASFAVGTWNKVHGNDNLVSGWNNDVTANQAGAIGSALNNTNNHSLVVGKNNEDKDGIQFAVANGADANNRSNSFEVHLNGDVIINNAQGDIDEGIFGN